MGWRWGGEGIIKGVSWGSTRMGKCGVGGGVGGIWVRSAGNTPPGVYGGWDMGVGAGVFGCGLQGGVCSKQVSSRSRRSSSSMQEIIVPEAARLHEDRHYTREHQVWQHPQEPQKPRRQWNGTQW